MTSDINGYNILCVIGTGSFGTCYKVLRKHTGQIFVWKAVEYGKMSEEKKKLLVSEVNLLSGLNHPNIVKYFDRIVHKPTSTIYIVMEWCAGGDLSTLINQCKMTDVKLGEKFVWRVLYQLSQALQLCHFLLPEGPVLHRDIKPANVFLDGNGNVKLGDFGLAYLLQEGQSSVFSNSVVGTPFYMSPEALQNSLYSEKSDIWSLGCLIYELCALQPPFGGSNLQQLIRFVHAGRFNRIPLEYSNDLQEMISYMLTVEHRARPNVESVLRHPQVIMHMVQESLECMNGKLFFSEDFEYGSKNNKNEKDLPSMIQSPCKCLEEIAKLKDSLHLKIKELKEWEDMLTMRESELSKKEKSIIKREKQVVVSECLVKEHLIQAERYLHYCRSHHTGSRQSQKNDDVCCNLTNDSAVFTDESETSFTFPTSTKLNPQAVERPTAFSRANSEKRVHFGTLPSFRRKCLSVPENDVQKQSYRSVSHLLIDGYNLPAKPVMKQTMLKCEKSGKSKSNKSKRLSLAVDESSKSGSSASSVLSDQFQWGEERRLWLEQKRVQYFCKNKENISESIHVCTSSQLHPQGNMDFPKKNNYSMSKC